MSILTLPPKPEKKPDEPEPPKHPTTKETATKYASVTVQMIVYSYENDRSIKLNTRIDPEKDLRLIRT